MPLRRFHGFSSARGPRADEAWIGKFDGCNLYYKWTCKRNFENEPMFYKLVINASYKFRNMPKLSTHSANDPIALTTDLVGMFVEICQRLE